MTTETNPTVATEAADTVSVTKADQDSTTEQGRCGGRHGPCGGKGEHGRCDWKNKRRMKIIGAVVLITLFGFMLGRGSAHHRAHHMDGHHGRHQQMESYSRGANAPSLSTLLDGIGATAEQRSKAVELFQR